MTDTKPLTARQLRLLNGKPARRRMAIQQSKRIAVLTTHPDSDKYQVVMLEVKVLSSNMQQIHAGINFGEEIENLRQQFGKNLLIVFDSEE